jgi:hypothetical protein
MEKFCEDLLVIHHDLRVTYDGVLRGMVSRGPQRAVGAPLWYFAWHGPSGPTRRMGLNDTTRGKLYWKIVAALINDMRTERSTKYGLS